LAVRLRVIFGEAFNVKLNRSRFEVRSTPVPG